MSRFKKILFESFAYFQVSFFIEMLKFFKYFGMESFVRYAV